MRRRKARERSGRFVAEGVRTVEELLRSPIRIRGALVSPSLEQAPRGTALRAALVERGVEVAEVDEREFASAAETESPQGILAVADIPERTLDGIALTASARLLILDGIQDPGNVGTMVRTAAAFGVAATVALPGTVDLWNAKVVRSAMGAIFMHQALAADWDALSSFLTAHEIPLWSSDVSGTPVGTPVGSPVTIPRPSRLAIAVGNEGGGVSARVRERSERQISIPIEHVESLNVAVATGILLYVLR
jgi:RNA methyltransferase, TrmH family